MNIQTDVYLIIHLFELLFEYTFVQMFSCLNVPSFVHLKEINMNFVL